MNDMEALQSNFAIQMTNIENTAKEMLEIARGGEWSPSAFHLFDEILQHLEKADEAFCKTPNEPDKEEDDKWKT